MCTVLTIGLCSVSAEEHQKETTGKFCLPACQLLLFCKCASGYWISDMWQDSGTQRKSKHEVWNRKRQNFIEQNWYGVYKLRKYRPHYSGSQNSSVCLSLWSGNTDLSGLILKTLQVTHCLSPTVTDEEMSELLTSLHLLSGGRWLQTQTICLQIWLLTTLHFDE